MRPSPPRDQRRRGGGDATACIQVHGGMGYTWELDAHLFLKRAIVLDVTSAPQLEAAIDALAATL